MTDRYAMQARAADRNNPGDRHWSGGTSSRTVNELRRTQNRNDALLAERMIRRDYILRMIEQFAAGAAAKIKALREVELWQETAASVNEELQRLAGKNAEAIARLSETEILALLDGKESRLR